jgi:hypothetical protein
MAEDLIKHGPNVIHPETESAVGSRNSLVRDGRDEYSEARLMIDESVDKVLNHIHAKLPPEVLSRLDVMGGIKSKLHSYFNQNYQNMLNRFVTTLEDELGKKVRDMIDMEELRGLNRYAPRPVSYLLDRIAGADKFNTSEVEKSIVNMYGHLHGHVQREMNDLETHTNSLLRRKTDVGAFVRGENAYAIVKCSFRDNADKPETVYDIKLALNILDSELVSRIYPYQVEVAKLIKDVVAKHVVDALTKELQAINENLVDEGKQELRPEEKIFERIKALDNHTSDDDNENSKRFTHVSKKVLDAVEGLRAEIPFEEYDPLRLRENVYKLIESENIRNRGFNTAVNALTHVLDWSRMGYQHVENYKSARALILREYAETNTSLLPDERYQLRLEYYDPHQLRSMREAYALQLGELERTIREVFDVVQKIYEEDREQNAKDDWESFSKRLLEQPEKRSWFAPRAEEEAAAPAEPAGPAWNEITFIPAKTAASVADHPTSSERVNDLKGRFPVMRDRLAKVFEEDVPDLRVILEGRIQFLEREFNRFASQVNPFHIQPGLLLDLDVVTIKRRSSTMMIMANVLNEFLYTVSAGFHDQAFAEFSRRRSTQRADLTETFVRGTGTSEGAPAGEEVFE